MRRVRDQYLPEPYRTWTDPSVPLPPGVTVLPRTVGVRGSVLVVSLALMGCVGVGLPIAIVVPAATGAGEWAMAGLIAAAPIGFLVWTVQRLWRTISAHRDQKAGVLRLGILVGPEGLLVRLTPNWCYPVSMDRFVRAEEWSGPGTEGSDYLRIVTLDGPVDIWDHEITASAADVNGAVAAARGAKG